MGGGSLVRSPAQAWRSRVDGRGGTSMATVRVTVTPINDQPQAADDALSLAEDGTASASVATNDSPSGDGGNVASVDLGQRQDGLAVYA